MQTAQTLNGLGRGWTSARTAHVVDLVVSIVLIILVLVITSPEPVRI